MILNKIFCLKHQFENEKYNKENINYSSISCGLVSKNSILTSDEIDKKLKDEINNFNNEIQENLVNISSSKTLIDFLIAEVKKLFY